jgi:hypothetical protein
MFGRIGSLWRRLVGTQPDSPPAGQEERRVWVRFPASLETTLRPARAADDTRLSARVRDISQGGVSLLVNRAFETGDLLNVELPGPRGHTHTVLACVVHVRALPGGEWALGCNFARELDDADLEAFGAKRLKPPGNDQRNWQRFACNVKATCLVVADPAQERWGAQVLNISPSGVGLLTTRPVEPGTLLSVDLESPHGTATRTMLACVVHVTPRTGGETALGCNFIRALSEDDLEALLENG